MPPYTTITAQCVATLSLERGQITLQGLVEFQGEDDPGAVHPGDHGRDGRLPRGERRGASSAA